MLIFKTYAFFKLTIMMSICDRIAIFMGSHCALLPQKDGNEEHRPDDATDLSTLEHKMRQKYYNDLVRVKGKLFASQHALLADDIDSNTENSSKASEISALAAPAKTAYNDESGIMDAAHAKTQGSESETTTINKSSIGKTSPKPMGATLATECEEKHSTTGNSLDIVTLQVHVKHGDDEEGNTKPFNAAEEGETTQRVKEKSSRSNKSKKKSRKKRLNHHRKQANHGKSNGNKRSRGTRAHGRQRQYIHKSQQQQQQQKQSKCIETFFGSHTIAHTMFLADLSTCMFYLLKE
uniref:Uncharacterized protein n=1 Tax=Glossina austeni TaxID=7395 RepID=A0A1A9VKZ6_GLOAU